MLSSMGRPRPAKRLLEADKKAIADVVLKLRAGGIQDVYDVAGVIAVNGDRLDPEYLARMVPHMGAQEKWKTAQRLAREVR